MNSNIDPPFHLLDPDQPWYGEGRPGGVSAADEVEEKVDEEAEEIVKDAEEEVKENLEPAVEVVEQAVQEVVQQRDEEQPDLSDIVDLLPPGMLEAVNKSLGSDYQKPEKKKREATGNVTNNRILKTVVQNLQKIQGQLDSIDNELKKQNLMISDAMATTISNLNSIETTHSGLNDKFDAILQAFEAQTAAKKAEIDERQGAIDEAKMEGQEKVASTFGIKKDDDRRGGGGGGRSGGLSNYLKRFAKFLWKRFAPKWLRSRLRLRTIPRLRYSSDVEDEVCTKKSKA